MTYLEGIGLAYIFQAVTQREENGTVSKETPSGQLEVTIANPYEQRFEVGKDYFLNILPIE